MTAKLSKSKNLQFLTILATSRKFKENLIGEVTHNLTKNK